MIDTMKLYLGETRRVGVEITVDGVSNINFNSPVYDITEKGKLVESGVLNIDSDNTLWFLFTPPYKGVFDVTATFGVGLEKPKTKTTILVVN